MSDESFIATLRHLRVQLWQLEDEVIAAECWSCASRLLAALRDNADAFEEAWARAQAAARERPKG